MTSGQWDLNALEALEREALGTFEIIEIPERLCSKLKQPTSILTTTATVSNDMVELELQDHIKHCSCSCNHMGYGNFMDYQPTGIDKHLELTNWKCRLHHIQPHDLSESTTFGDLPDVTEHSYNPTVLPDSISNTELSITSQRSSTPHCHQNLSSCNSNNNNNNNNNSNSRDRDHHSNTNISSSLTNLNINGQQHPHHTNSKTKHQPHKKPTKKFNYFLFLILLFLFVIIIILISISLKYFFGGYKLDRNSHEQRISLVEHILRNTPLIDGHNDLPWNIRRFAHNRLEYVNFTHGLDKIEPWYRSPWSQTDLPRMKQGLIGAQFWSAYVPCEAQGLDAVQLTLEQIDLIIRLIEANYRDMKLVTTTSDIISTHTNGLISSLIGVEGGHCIGSSLGVLRSMYALGVRYLTLTHTCDTSWAGTADSMDKGLSPFGRAIIKEMNRLGMIIDLSHTSDATAKDVFETTRAPVIYSHSAARSLCNLTRNIGDDFLRKIAENGGIVMVSFYSLHVACGKSATISDVIAHINYIRSVAGVQHVGLGAGYDGIDSTPQGLENVSKYPNLFSKLLEDPSWNEENLSLLAGKNFLRVFESVENVRDYLKRADIHPYENLEPPKRSPCTYMPS